MVVTQTDVSPTDQKKQEERTRHDIAMTRRGTSLSMSPLTLLQRFFSDDIVNVLDQVGRGSFGSAPETSAEWAPTIDVIQRGNELVVRADLPGVSIDDVVVEVGDDTITISGERRQERTEDSGGIYRFERTYGRFFRAIALPDGAIADQAKATFKDGVLEIVVPSPPAQVSRGHRLEISRGDGPKTGAVTDEPKRNPGRS